MTEIVRAEEFAALCCRLEQQMTQMQRDLALLVADNTALRHALITAHGRYGICDRCGQSVPVRDPLWYDGIRFYCARCTARRQEQERMQTHTQQRDAEGHLRCYFCRERISDRVQIVLVPEHVGEEARYPAHSECANMLVLHDDD